MGITLTEKAANEVKRIIADQKLEPETVLRVGVTGGGCSGFSYALGFDKQFDAEGRQQVRVSRRAGRRRQEERAVPRRHDGRLLRRHREARLHVRQSERGQDLRLRQLVPGLIGPVVSARRFVSFTRLVTTVSRWPGWQAVNLPSGRDKLGFK